MIERQSWLTELRRVVFIVSVAALLGWPLGYPYQILSLTLAAIIVLWLYQLWRIQKWLSQTDSEPPETFGIWGVIFDRIYLLQRKNREARSRLQSALDYMQDSMASMRDGVAMVDSTGSIEWSNDASLRLLGLQFPRDRGQHILNLVRMPEFHEYFNTGDYSRTLMVPASGELEWSLEFEVTRFGSGNRLLFVRDVTAKAQLEQMRRDFVGNVSHELRTPLTVIKGYLDTMLSAKQDISPQFVRPLQQMDQQAVRMENLLKDLLWLSRIESVSSEPKIDSVDVAGLLEELRDEWRVNYPDRNIELAVETRHQVPGDYRELHSAVSNLLVNALKYSEADTTVKVSWCYRDGEYLLQVIDAGIGIEAVHLPRLTERFYRVDESRNSETGGTGLGLAIVKHVVAAHNAELRLDSKSGLGSVFTIAFAA